jgi:hypothetical protein
VRLRIKKRYCGELYYSNKNRKVKGNVNQYLLLVLLVASCTEKSIAFYETVLVNSRYYHKKSGVLLEGEYQLYDSLCPELRYNKIYKDGVEIRSEEYYNGDMTISSATTVLNNPFPNVFARITLDSVSEGFSSTVCTYLCFTIYSTTNFNTYTRHVVKSYYSRYLNNNGIRKVDYISVGTGNNPNAYVITKAEEF